MSNSLIANESSTILEKQRFCSNELYIIKILSLYGSMRLFTTLPLVASVHTVPAVCYQQFLKLSEGLWRVDLPSRNKTLT